MQSLSKTHANSCPHSNIRFAIKCWNEGGWDMLIHVAYLPQQEQRPTQISPPHNDLAKDMVVIVLATTRLASFARKKICRQTRTFSFFTEPHSSACKQIRISFIRVSVKCSSGKPSFLTSFALSLIIQACFQALLKNSAQSTILKRIRNFCASLLIWG